ncbi:uncharacterized protein [Elaeis guineensis]|uniref:uncharacterized protein isoform X2 n=1 Tax=Elaeis guineensis var. tenera TaxID=51953 RepID=UPI003C6CEF80
MTIQEMLSISAKIEPGTEVLQKNDTVDHHMAFIRPRDEPYDDDSIGFETPVALIYPSHPISNPIPAESKVLDMQELLPTDCIALYHGCSPLPLFKMCNRMSHDVKTEMNPALTPQMQDLMDHYWSTKWSGI